jgi:hypothetical protein
VGAVKNREISSVEGSSGFIRAAGHPAPDLRQKLGAWASKTLISGAPRRRREGQPVL